MTAWATPSKALTADRLRRMLTPSMVDGVLTRAAVGSKLHPRTSDEIANAVVPVDEAVKYLDLARYGAVDGGNATAALMAAIHASRRYAETRIDTIGGSDITMYRSAIIEIPAGVYVIDPDTLVLTQEMGITFRGQGSRRFTNAIRGTTTILVSGASSGFGIKLYRNGARSVHFEDLDICYEDASFTGHLIDMMDSPGLKFRRCYLGTFGITGGTRVQSAASLLRLTYLEDVSLVDCTLDGAVDGIWVDDIRSEMGNPFGGWGLVLDRCTFYDFTGSMVRHDGGRTLSNLTIRDCHFNPINVNCSRAINVNNVDSLDIRGCIFTPSTASKANIEWVLLDNVTGVVHANMFSDLTKAGTLAGVLDIRGNVIFGTDGFTLKNGIITGSGNEFGQGVHGWELIPDNTLCVDLGPDWFKSGVSGNSYRISADSALLSGRITYAAELDSSGLKFTNASDRISIRALDSKFFNVHDAAYSISIRDTGRVAVATGASGAQVFTLPAPVPGCELAVLKNSTNALTVAAGSPIIIAGSGGLKTSLTAANAADLGPMLRFRAFGDAWVLTDQQGAWTLA